MRLPRWVLSTSQDGTYQPPWALMPPVLEHLMAKMSSIISKWNFPCFSLYLLTVILLLWNCLKTLDSPSLQTLIIRRKQHHLPWAFSSCDWATLFSQLPLSQESENFTESLLEIQADFLKYLTLTRISRLKELQVLLHRKHPPRTFTSEIHPSFHFMNLFDPHTGSHWQDSSAVTQRHAINLQYPFIHVFANGCFFLYQKNKFLVSQRYISPNT